jgi:O-antigen ligase
MSAPTRGPRVRTSAAPTWLEPVRSAVPAIVTGLAVVLLVPRAASSMVVGIVLLLALLGVAVLAVVGFEGAAIGFLFLGTALSPLDNLRPVPALAFASTSDIILLLGVFALLPVLIGRRLTVDPLFLGAGAAFVVVGLFTSALAVDPGTSLNNLLRLVVGALMLPIAYMAWRPSRPVVVALACAYLLGNVANVVAAYTVGAVGDGGRRIGYSTHPNVMGLCAMLAIALVPFLLASVPRAWRPVVLAGMAVCAWGVWISGSRAALVAVAAVLVVWVVVSRSVNVALTLTGLALVPLYYVGVNISTLAASDNALGRLLGGGSSQGSNAERELIAREAWEVFLGHPVLGNGLSDVLKAHNIYLQVAAAVGVVGFAFFLLLLAAPVLRALRLDGVGGLLVLPCLGYIMIGAMTTILWDRYVWSVLALPFLASAAFAAVGSGDDEGDTDDSLDAPLPAHPTPSTPEAP